MEYTFSKYADLDVEPDAWMFDRYHYCPANGSLLLPMYAFDCSDEDG